MTFGSKLKMLRNKDGLTQLQLSKKLDTSKSNISKYEADAIEPNMKTLIMIAHLFGVSTDYLLGLNNNMDAKLNPFLPAGEEQELLFYYNQLPVIDRRWIMGQIIDLIKKEESNLQNKVVGK